MHLARPFTALLLSTVLAVSAPLSAIGQKAYAQTAATQEAGRVLLDAVREAVRANPALADGTGNQALLTGVRDAVARYPSMQAEIVAKAQALRPQLAVQIQQTAQLAAQYPAATMTVAQSAPSATYSTTTAGTTAAAQGAMVGGVGDMALLGLAGAAVVGVGAVAIAGYNDKDGSGGGGGGTTPPVESFETQEYKNQWGLGDIKAAEAYARGATGAGVTVAVLDSGINETHREFAGQMELPGYNAVDETDDVEDTDGHGSHVAGIIGAKKDGNTSVANNMHGVAFDAKILPIEIFDATGVATGASVIRAVNYARTEGAKVLNGSYGPKYGGGDGSVQPVSGMAPIAAAYQQAADAGTVLVFSAGNNFEDNPAIAMNPNGSAILPYIRPANAGSGIYDDGGNNYDFSALEGMLVAVVATDSSGAIASFSNRCGVAADWCIAAPGVGIISAGIASDTGYANYSGTSMAAPHVSGAVAVLMDMFPELEPEEIVERLFLSANKEGIYAVEATYGQGFLDLEKATRPIGALKVATGKNIYSGASFDLTASNMQLGAAFGDGLSAALVGRKLAVFDQQRATFLVDLGDFTRMADSRFDLDMAMRRFQSRFGAEVLKMPDGSQLHYTMVSLGEHQSAARDPALGDNESVMELAYSRPMGDATWRMNYNVNPSTLFGLQQRFGEDGRVDGNGMLSRDAFAAPYLAFAKQGYSMGTHMPLGEAFSLNLGAFQGYALGDEMREKDDRAESYGHMAELVYDHGALTLTGQMGMLTEKQSFLGSRSEGAFDLESGTHTSFAGINTALAMTPTWSLVGTYYRGVSTPKLDGHSLFNRVSDVQTESFSLGMVGKGVFHENDRFGILGNQPLRVVDGEAGLSLATGRSRSGMLYYQDYDVNLAPTGRELNLEAFYHFNLPDTQTQLMSAMMFRREPGHIANAPDEGVFLLQLQQPF